MKANEYLTISRAYILDLMLRKKEARFQYTRPVNGRVKKMNVGRTNERSAQRLMRWQV